MSGPEARKAEANRPGREGRRLPPRVERRVRLSRVLMVWEALWPALWPTAGLAGLFVVAALFGLFARLPMGIHWGLLGAYGALTAWALRQGVTGFRWPDREAALRRLEEVSGLAHQPLSAYEDVAARGTGDAALWQAHQRWVVGRLRRLRVGLASPGLAARDPHALRAVVALLLLIAVAGTGEGRMARIAAALLPGVGAAKSFIVEAWITPPAYTGLTPIYLERQETEARPVELTVPANSVFSLRVHGPRNPPALQIAAGERTKPAPLRDMGDRNYIADTRIESSTDFELTEGGRAIRNWSVKVVADEKPTIAFAKPLQQTASGSLRFAHTVHDDYGVATAEVRIALDGGEGTANLASEATTPTAGAPASPIPRVTPPAIALPLPTVRPKDADGETYVDLTPHPWAGLPVTVTLVARDDAGQEGTSDPVSFVLPARDFAKPLAAAVAEQRQRLALDPGSRERVARVLDAFTRDGERTIDDMPVYLALRAAYWRLTSARHGADLEGIFDLLWAIALHIEDGDLSLAEGDLRRARDALAEALAKGAGNDEVERLMAELNEAFQRYMEALAARGGEIKGPLESFAPRDARSIDRDELEKMLNAIGELARTGAREQAKALLERLQAIMENMRIPDPDAAMSEGEQAMADGVDRMGKLIELQRQLMDETFQQSGDGTAPGEGGAEGKAGSGHGKKTLEELKRAQEALREALDVIVADLDKAGIKVLRPLEGAGKSMDSAGEKLGEGRTDRATAAQGQAIEALREGAQGLVDELMSSLSERRSVEGSGKGMTDPLGRQLPSDGTDRDADVAVPDIIDIQRAREILEELRRRAGELDRPKLELDYLDRLLKRF